MNCNIVVTDNFKRDAKHLIKKYISLKEELIDLQAQLQQNPRIGTLIAEDVYKIRLAVKSKGRGKSGGMRVISYVAEMEIQVDENEDNQEVTVFLLTIYDKSEMENIEDNLLKSWIEEIHFTLNIPKEPNAEDKIDDPNIAL